MLRWSRWTDRLQPVPVIAVPPDVLAERSRLRCTGREHPHVNSPLSVDRSGS